MKLHHLSQYKKLGVFLYKYGNSDLLKHSGLSSTIDEKLKEEQKGMAEVKPSEMVEDLKDLGPSFIKLGQLLSTRPDLLPPPYIEALSELQDNLEPVPFEEIRTLVEEELGTRISKAFLTFDTEPLASASLGQVHMAELRDGIKVVVKVQRPGVRKQVMEELEVLETTAGFLNRNFSKAKRFDFVRLIEQFKTTLLRELNYLKEAEHLKILKENLKEYEHLVIPEPVSDYTTDKILCMQYLKGTKITEISPLTKNHLNGRVLADELFQAYLKQIVVDGFMHADPHPGNVHLIDGEKLALLDLGMVAYISEDYRDKYLHLLLAVGEAKSDRVVKLLQEMSRKLPDADEETFRTSIRDLVQENYNADMRNLEMGKLIFALIRTAGKNGYILPAELSYVAKALLNLDQAGRILAPDFQPNEAIRRHALSLFQSHMFKDLTSVNFFSSLLEGKRLLEKLPSRMNKILENVAENNVEVKVDAFNEKNMMVGLQKIANRITLGLILASLVVGSALLMSVPTTFTIFGYPGLAIIAFLLAALGAVILAFRILYSDE